MTLGELQGRCPNTGTRIATHTHTHDALSHPVSVSYPADWHAGVEPVLHRAATTVTALSCPASISVMRGNTDSAKLSQQIFLKRGWWSEAGGGSVASGLQTGFLSCEMPREDEICCEMMTALDITEMLWLTHLFILCMSGTAF